MAFLGEENGLPDDIDCLFHLLRPVKPPQELLQRILAQARMPYSYGTTPLSQRLQPQRAKDMLEQLVLMPGGECGGRRLRRKLY
ncbi:MAG TPA: hypothetical protein VKV40_19195 [Ktedonobacteraceae bacterium]|nr:hypothetical protein [Ktedonobacteraceae bacterium]